MSSLIPPLRSLEQVPRRNLGKLNSSAPSWNPANPENPGRRDPVHRKSANIHHGSWKARREDPPAWRPIERALGPCGGRGLIKVMGSRQVGTVFSGRTKEEEDLKLKKKGEGDMIESWSYKANVRPSSRTASRDHQKRMGFLRLQAGAAVVNRELTLSCSARR